MGPRKHYAYLAGILDGEGCITCAYQTTRKSVKIRVGQKVPSLGEWLVANFGGNLYQRETDYGPMWYWQCSEKIAKRVLPLAVPYMIVKRQHARVAIKLMSASSTKRRRYYARQLRELNKPRTRIRR